MSSRIIFQMYRNTIQGWHLAICDKLLSMPHILSNHYLNSRKRFLSCYVLSLDLKVVNMDFNRVGDSSNRPSIDVVLI